MKNEETKINYVKTPTVYQMEVTECGAASLAMILGYYGCYIPLEQLRVECGVGRDGSSIKNIKKAAKAYGLEPDASFMRLEKAVELPLPTIFYWNYSHFVVYEGRKGRYYYINDPSKGRRKLTYEQLKEGYSRVALQFEKTDKFEKINRKEGVMRTLQQRLTNNKKAVHGLLFSGLLLVFPGMLIPMLSRIFVDQVLTGEDPTWATVLIPVMCGALIFQLFFTYLRSKVLVRLQTKMKLTASYRFLHQMFRLPVNFFEQRLPGGLAMRVDNNNNISNFLSGELAENVMNLFVAFFYLFLMLLYSPILTGIGLAGVIINVLLGRFMADRLENLAQANQRFQDKLWSTCYSGLAVLETVKATGTEDKYTSKMIGVYADYADATREIAEKTEVLNAMPAGITRFFDVMVLVAGGYLVIRGNLTTGGLVAFSQLLLAFTTPVNALIGFFNRMKILKADIRGVNDVEQYADRFVKEDTDQGQAAEKMTQPRHLTGQIEFRDVSFGYTLLEEPFLKHASFKLMPGNTVALVGTSGSGKSTIGKLANGLLLPWSGEILFDGRPISSYQEHIFYYYVGTASQNISMFSGTVRDNLTLWNPNVDQERMVQAAKDACIHDMILQLPGAYDARVMENGLNFSGGERQRLEIARALVSNPSVLILDEATSALDPLVEKQVMENIRRRGCTCILIAHRLSTIRDCDEILVMKDGEIVQRGTHETMKDLPGLYQDLIKAE